MRGQVFVAPAMTALMANAFYNESLVPLTNALLQAPMLLLPLPQIWERKSFAKLAAWLLATRSLLALGIYRSGQAAQVGPHGRIDPTIPTHHYVYTAPPAHKTLMIRSDRILCVAAPGDV